MSGNWDLEGGSPCVHHWIIDSPAGETSLGVCKHCGTSREFRNESERTFYLAKKTQVAPQSPPA